MLLSSFGVAALADLDVASHAPLVPPAHNVHDTWLRPLRGSQRHETPNIIQTQAQSRTCSFASDKQPSPHGRAHVCQCETPPTRLRASSICTIMKVSRFTMASRTANFDETGLYGRKVHASSTRLVISPYRHVTSAECCAQPPCCSNLTSILPRHDAIYTITTSTQSFHQRRFACTPTLLSQTIPAFSSPRLVFPAPHPFCSSA
ncbi:hypothetical protein FB567DRAFT_117985 [Paraphoma chrysanthemicola]|uniref:Uncharacterized protein n=1 Tax=Paraphoma chrysanthemicola TaxID=798071 RepID=A0A8K0VWE8_9PLEO|nr:hypothetical protein FB567DRAFT_117985 [Paraphoma chrysanthemicola]